MINPYRGLDDAQFWAKAVTMPAPGHLDPMVGSYKVENDQKVATIGSCFAQNLSAHLVKRGLNFFVDEQAPAGMRPEEARARNYGVFSARYGNVYSVRQALQLFDRAYGRFHPVDDVWERRGGFVDAFRPQIEPAPLPSSHDVRASAREHLVHVRNVFEGCDWLVFTLGLTEAWRSKLDGAIYPTAPGVAGGSFDPSRYEFVNFSAGDCAADLGAFLESLHEVNRKCRVLLTVSPVPLIATYERRHVLVSTTYSKSALRVAADEAERRFDFVVYFPSYEIITSAANGGRYYQDDLRQVTDVGVRHVMRVFSRHFLEDNRDNDSTIPEGGSSDSRSVETDAAPSPVVDETDIVCDEEVIAKSIAMANAYAA